MNIPSLASNKEKKEKKTALAKKIQIEKKTPKATKILIEKKLHLQRRYRLRRRIPSS